MSPAKARRLVGLVPQTPADLLYLETVAQECAQADRESDGASTGSARPLLDRLAPGIAGEMHPRDLSEGQRLSLVLAVQLAAAPAVVLLDEPTRGLDYRAKRALIDIIDVLAAEGRAVVIATHDVEFVAAAADRVVVMAAGDIVADGPTAEVVGASPAFAPQVAKILAPLAYLTLDQVRRLWPRRRRDEGGGGRSGSGHRRSTGRPSCWPRSSASWPSSGPSWWPPGRSATPPWPRSCSAPCLILVLAVVFAEIADGGIDAKAIAMLGVLSAIGAALRPLGAGTAGIETVFFTLVIAGRVFGPGFGFTLGCTTLFASALITGGVGPWMPYQMFGCAWVGLFAGLLPPATGKREVLMLAVYGALSGYFFGFMLNLSFWPFYLDAHSAIAYLPGAALGHQRPPVPGVRRHHLAGLGHRPGHHQLRLHPARRSGHAGHLPPGLPEGGLRGAHRVRPARGCPSARGDRPGAGRGGIGPSGTETR